MYTTWRLKGMQEEIKSVKVVLSGLSFILVGLFFVWDMRKVKFKNVNELYGGDETDDLELKAWNFFVNLVKQESHLVCFILLKEVQDRQRLFFFTLFTNYALVAYDPLALGPVGASVVHAAELLSEPALRHGDSVYLVGLSRSLQATSRKLVVTNPSAALNIGSADYPRYRATNMEIIELDTDEHGRVQAIWGSFSTQPKFGSSTSENHQFVGGIPVYAISQVLDKIISGANGLPLLINGVKRPMPLVRILEVELYPTLLSQARSFGLSNDWIQALVKKDPVRRQVLRVKGCLAGSKAENLLEQGNMV
ncbi:hypothetical protein REPUB_Repub17cG0009500 [Reevesia pubescens]